MTLMYESPVLPFSDMMKFGVRKITVTTYIAQCTLIHNESRELYNTMFTTAFT